MAGKGSKKVIVAALIGNGLVAVTKFIAAGYTGSSAMAAEGIHSVVDTGNQGLLLYGMRRAARPADADHPFGHGVELYFWAFVVAILIFAVGSGVSLYEGFQKLAEPHGIEDPYINYIVLGVAVVLEAGAWRVAYKEFNAQRGRHSLVRAVRQSKDPTVFTVLFEDTAAMLGLIVAFIGILFVDVTGWVAADALATIAIGLILGATAVLLAIETKSLLVGEAADPEIVAEVRTIVSQYASIEEINELRSLHQGPTDILLAISVDFRNDLSAGDVENTISLIEKAIKTRFPLIKRVFIEAQSIRHHQEMIASAQRAASSH